MPELRRRKGMPTKRKDNPYSQRGQEQFAALCKELNEAREHIAADLGVPSSLVKFSSAPDEDKWVPFIIPEQSSSDANVLKRTSSSLITAKETVSVNLVERAASARRSLRRPSIDRDNFLRSSASFRSEKAPQHETVSFKPHVPSTLRSGSHVNASSNKSVCTSMNPRLLSVISSPNGGAVHEESLGHFVLISGLGVVLFGLLVGYWASLIGLVCWWYLLSSVRNEMRDKLALQDRHRTARADKPQKHQQIKAHEHHRNKQESSLKNSKTNTSDMISNEHKKKVIMDGLLARSYTPNKRGKSQLVNL
ncbi:hypothetical protein KP509_29G057400 [Ceratopteris richardii]|uniref:Uncharacterized protein n=1 Tax=Ceratopteris richardii TaxID=49495 RepID=A0A8T2R9M0_CERRI|nr:hypothetical protein KP509_29G057400 [Ceratopteris richardii]